MVVGGDHLVSIVFDDLTAICNDLKALYGGGWRPFSLWRAFSRLIHAYLWKTKVRVREIQGYRGDAGEIQGRYRGDAGGIQRRYSGDIMEI